MNGIRRVVVALAALCVAAWMALGLVQSDSQRRAEERYVNPNRPLTEAQAARAERLVDRAGFANPDQQLEIDRAVVAMRAGHPRHALAQLTGVTRREPDNIAAWAWVRFIAASLGDDTLHARANARILELRPRRGLR